MDEDPLDRDTRLARLSKGAGHHARRGPLQVRVVVHDAAGVATQFERHAFAPGPFVQAPAYLGTAGERQQRDALVLDQRIGLMRGCRQDG